VKLAALNPLRPLMRAVRAEEVAGSSVAPAAVSDTPMPQARPYTLGTASAASRSTIARADATPRVRAAAPVEERPEPVFVPPQPAAAAFAPVRNDVGLGLMSGRGLY
jgi:hypothetical protein